MSLPLCRACSWSGIFGSKGNRFFDLRVAHLKGDCFNIQGLRLLLRPSLTVGLTSVALTRSRLLDGELKLNLDTLRLPRPWDGGVHLNPPFFTSFPIYNHSLYIWALFSPRNVFSLFHHYTLLRIGDKNVVRRE